MMEKVILASNNMGKIKEFREILKDMDIELVSMKEAGIDVDIEEYGRTFSENALIKARTISEMTGCVTLADDSGLEVDWLNKEPGVHSARFMGHDTPYEIKNQAIIDKLKGVIGSDRSARFVAVVAIAFPEGDEFAFRGTMEGIIGDKPLGENGFGYDDQVNENGEIIDDYRIDYMRKHIQEMKLAIEEGVDCRGYLSWGPVDILSSRAQMKKRYGFIYVNRDNDDLKDMRRIKKKSFHWFKHVIETNGEEL